MALKYSRQRQVIKDFLMTRKDHPTADVVYMNVKHEYPNISLGTVYRNLSLLTELGEIRRLRMGDGVDHYDADTSQHYHVICTECGSVTDLKARGIDNMINLSDLEYDGKIQGHVAYFYGVCADCCSRSIAE